MDTHPTQAHDRGTTGRQPGLPDERNTMRRLGLLITALLALLLVSPPQAQAEAQTQIHGPAIYDTTQCPGPPAGYEDFDTYPGLYLTGSLTACLYTRVDDFRQTPSGAYVETGSEVLVGSLDGGPVGTFTTRYTFEGKFDPSGAEIHGRCQHPIVRGSGTGGFDGATGRLNFKDFIGATVTYAYRGHISL